MRPWWRFLLLITTNPTTGHDGDQSNHPRDDQRVGAAAVGAFGGLLDLGLARADGVLRGGLILRHE
jgi:hypothetical protein